MTVAYVVVTVIAIVANGGMAVADLLRVRAVVENSAAVGVPEPWLTWLGLLKGAGAVGLLLGLFGVPFIGEAAALGLTLFFVCAVLAHFRARNYDLTAAVAFLVLAAATLVLHLAT